MTHKDTNATRTDAAWLDAHWMPFTGNRQFKAHPRMFVAAEGAYYIDADGKQDLRRAVGPVVLRPRPRPRARSSRRSASRPPRSTTRPRSSSATRASFALANKIKELTPAGPRLRVLHRLGLRGRGHLAQDGARVLAREGPGHEDAADRPREGLSRRQLRRHLGRRHRRQPQDVRPGASRPTTCPTRSSRSRQGAGVHARHARDTAPSSRTICSADRAARRVEHRRRDRRAVRRLGRAWSSRRVGYLQRLREICTAHDILLSSTRSSPASAARARSPAPQAFGVTPDILNLAKQVTNGAQPLGAVVVKKEIYDTFMAAGGPEYMLEFPHGYTYSAHPVACAAGVAALDLLVQEKRRRARRASSRRTSRTRCTASRAASTSPTSATSGSPPGLTHRRRARRAGEAPVRDRDEVPREGLLRPLRRRHHPARAAVHRREGRDRSPGQRARRRARRDRVTGCYPWDSGGVHGRRNRNDPARRDQARRGRGGGAGHAPRGARGVRAEAPAAHHQGHPVLGRAAPGRRAGHQPLRGHRARRAGGAPRGPAPARRAGRNRSSTPRPRMASRRRSSDSSSASSATASGCGSRPR